MRTLDLSKAQAWSERNMPDTCTITRPGVRTYDEDTEEWSDGTPTTVYSGKCRAQWRGRETTGADLAGTQTVLGDVLVAVPVSVEDVRVEDAVTVTASRDASLVDRPMAVESIARSTYAVHRLLGCEDRQEQ